MSELKREEPSCPSCGSNVRWRAIVQVLSLNLFGASLALQDFPARPDVRGVGLSDWDGYALPLSGRLDYRNTYFHQEPKLDIRDIPAELEGAFDFVISSEVFEHVPPPVSVAFANVRRLLKPGGVLIFTAPYAKHGKTMEHFPELYDYELAERDGRRVLKNRTRAGVTQLFESLVFHGGEGETLEMRVFSERDLIEEFERAGFCSVKIYEEPDFEHGIYWQEDWSLPIAARTPTDEPA
jgi:SAM-dependent methyltransferase